MNLKKMLLVISLVILFITGCNAENIVEEKVGGDEAIYQKTMTKVQNDVNVIMNKDYRFVLDNMGMPYCTTYYIDLDKIKATDISSLDNEVNKIKLVYPKYTTENVLEDSAIYIELENNIVVDVQNYEFSDYNIKDEKVDCDNEIVINKFNSEINLPLSKIEGINLEEYIEKNKDELYDNIGTINPNFEVYCSKRNIKIKIYLLNEISLTNGKMLMISEKDNKIEDIGIVDNATTVDLVKEYLENN